MCTAITFKTKDSYFGRTLDIEFEIPMKVTITPRNYPFDLRRMPSLKSHYAMIGMAMVKDGYPLYFDGVNEQGLCMAGLNFPHNAHYFPEVKTKENITPFEFIPYILSQCKNITEVRSRLDNINLCDISFSHSLPLSPLHWIIADKNTSITVEPTAQGVKIYDNPVGVLTNNPTFDYHMTRLCDFMKISPFDCENTFGFDGLTPYSKGMGAIGLPGDLSSSSRFVRAAFVKLNSVCGDGEDESVSQFFHIFGSVEQQRGCVKTPDGSLELTKYTSCINADKGIYYYTTYENRSLCAVDMHRTDLNGDKLHIYPLTDEQYISWQN
ncbi:MAG: choloylglycine hydrolase [Clostridia bacterium]|nr:choloylglycine hydrolase [Clostridia bacterium]